MTKNTNYCQQFIEAYTGVIVWIFNSKAIDKGIMTGLRGCCSRYFHRNSYRIALSVPPLRPSCSWKSSEHCHPLCTWIKTITWILLNNGHKLTCWIWCMCLSPQCSVRVLICIWSQMSCCKWLTLSLEFNFAVRHTSGHTKPATRSYDVTTI